MLDLVILQACHSEVVGRVFQQKYAKYVICINNAKQVWDVASINFTRNLYTNLLRGNSVCEAFDMAVSQTQIVLGSSKAHEASKGDVFVLLCHDSYPMRRTENDMREHVYFTDPNQYDDDEKGYICKSKHILLKRIPDFSQKSPTNRLNERLDTVRALCRYDRFIFLRYLYGDSKEQIANWSIRYVADRKVFTGGIMMWDLENEISLHSFLDRFRANMINTDPKFKDLLAGNDYADSDIDAITRIQKLFQPRGNPAIPNWKRKHFKN